jgi:phosphate transport system permease protein
VMQNSGLTDEGPPAPVRGRGVWVDYLFKNLALVAAALVGVTLVATVLAIGYDSVPAIKVFGILGFLKSRAWNPVTQNFGAFVFIVGTLVSSCIALVLAVPLSFGVAVYISELAPRWVRKPVSAAVEMLASIPSIVYGLWGLLIFAPVFANCEPWINDHLGAIPWLGALFKGPPMGIGMLTAGIVLAVMILPYIAAIMRDVFMVTPAALKESAYGLGCTTWEVASQIILPYTRSAVVGAIFLGLGRALGETMAVTFVIGNSDNLAVSLLAPSASIPSVIANEFTEATTHLYLSSLIYLGLVLMAVTLVVRFLAVFLVRGLEHKAKGAR